MASAIKATLAKVTGTSSTTESGDDNDPSQIYKLQVTAGASYEDSTRHRVTVNGDHCVVSKRCKVAVRIQEHHGIPEQSVAHSSYFDDSAHKKDTYSIAFSWAPDENVSAEDLVWGIELVTSHLWQTCPFLSTF